MVTSWVSIPMKETIIVLLVGEMFVSVNLPLMSVIVPLVVPFTNTEAPITGSLFSLEITVPFTVTCACAWLIPTNKHTNSSNSVFFIMFVIDL